MRHPLRSNVLSVVTEKWAGEPWTSRRDSGACMRATSLASLRGDDVSDTSQSEFTVDKKAKNLTVMLLEQHAHAARTSPA